MHVSITNGPNTVGEGACLGWDWEEESIGKKETDVKL